jgi:hypothetical protein
MARKSAQTRPVVGFDDLVVQIPGHLALPLLHLLLQAALHLEGLALFFNLKNKLKLNFF